MEVPAIVGSALRTVLGMAFGGLVAKGYMTAEDINMVAGMLGGAGVLAWSIYQKAKAKKTT